MEPFHIIQPKIQKLPFIVSVPHCGTEFPDELKDLFKDEMRQQHDDTDWFVHQLYKFASEMGITIIYAKYSRWVIDLNRDPESKPLYNDGRIITALTTTTDFFGNAIYKDEASHPDTAEVERRLNEYYWPYYRAIENLMLDIKDEFGKVLLWDAHSIRRLVPTIRATPFPDMILGSNDETSASQELIDTALDTLRTGNFTINHNDPFKGGHITRYFGRPAQNQHALQLEMNKILYMNDEELKFHPGRAEHIQQLLRRTFNALIEQLK
jgi:N-formylglutamate deformylase